MASRRLAERERNGTGTYNWGRCRQRQGRLRGAWSLASKRLEEPGDDTAEELATDLDDRIAAAFLQGAKSVDVATLVEEASEAAAAADEAAGNARARALDPTLTAVHAAAARAEMEDAAFNRDRLTEAVRRLGERLLELHQQEEQARRRMMYEKARAHRDELAAELTRVYPPAAAQLAELLARVVASDEEIDYINAHMLPGGAERLLVAELVARGLQGFTGQRC